MTQQDFTIITGRQSPADEVFRARHLIDGLWRDSASGDVFERYSPAHGTLVSVTCQGAKFETNKSGAARL